MGLVHRKENPQRKVGVVTFNNEVAILGDGVAQTEIVAGDKLKNEAELQAIAEKHAIADYKPISESCDKLVDKLYDLQETGPTALGPALLMSLTMASKVPGSRVVVATDGLANVGLGSLDTTVLSSVIMVGFSGAGVYSRLFVHSLLAG